MNGKQFLQSLSGGQPHYGLFCCSYSPQAVEAVSYSGYDFLIFDAEHCANNLVNLHAQLLALAHSKTAAIVRVSELNLSQFKLYLDSGVHALMVPNVHTAEQAAQAVRYTRYPPAGIRGVAGSVRASRYGRDKPTLDQAQSQAVLMVQAESRSALENIDAIAGTDGVDVVFFGPNDLAADMGHWGNPTHPEVVQAIVQGMARVRAAGKVAGVLAGEKDCEVYLRAGASVVALGSDIGLLVAGADGLLKRVQAGMASVSP